MMNDHSANSSVLITAIFVSMMRIGKFRNLYARPIGRFVREEMRAYRPGRSFSFVRDIIRSLFMAQVRVIKIISREGTD